MTDEEARGVKGCDKPDLQALVRDDPRYPEGKYLVTRRDGSIAEWPSFVLGARDPMTPWTLRFYGILGFVMGRLRWSFVKSLWRFASSCREYRRTHGDGDPGKGIHRKDDPETIAKMRKGMSA